MEEIQVNIMQNTRVESTKKILRIKKKEPFEQVLEKISKKLGIEVKVLYNEEGAVVEDTSEIKDRETLYASQGEQFWPHNKIATTAAKPEEKTKILKLGIIGPPAVGKSALTVRYTQKMFIGEYLPSFEDIYRKNMMFDNEQVEVSILDSSGLDELVVMRPNWFKEREAFVMVYAIDSRVSFEAMTLFHEQLITFRANSEVPVILVGNKSDNEQNRQVKKEDGLKLAKSFGADFYETSAMKDINVTTVFEVLSRKLFALKYKPKAAKPEEKSCCSLL